MNTPCDWRGLSNVQCNAVGAHRMVWWRLVGAAPVCPPVSPHKGASIVQFPTHNTCIFGMETPLLRGRSGGHTGTAPTVSFGWIACGAVGFVWLDCMWAVDFVGQIARKWLFGLCGIVWKNMMEMGRGGACVPARVALQGRIRR